jgi:hypothetical protein
VIPDQRFILQRVFRCNACSAADLNFSWPEVVSSISLWSSAAPALE